MLARRRRRGCVVELQIMNSDNREVFNRKILLLLHWYSSYRLLGETNDQEHRALSYPMKSSVYVHKMLIMCAHDKCHIALWFWISSVYNSFGHSETAAGAHTINEPMSNNLPGFSKDEITKILGFTKHQKVLYWYPGKDIIDRALLVFLFINLWWTAIAVFYEGNVHQHAMECVVKLIIRKMILYGSLHSIIRHLFIISYGMLIWTRQWLAILSGGDCKMC